MSDDIELEEFKQIFGSMYTEIIYTFKVFIGNSIVSWNIYIYNLFCSKEP